MNDHHSAGSSHAAAAATVQNPAAIAMIDWTIDLSTMMIVPAGLVPTGCDPSPGLATIDAHIVLEAAIVTMMLRNLLGKALRIEGSTQLVQLHCFAIVWDFCHLRYAPMRLTLHQTARALPSSDERYQYSVTPCSHALQISRAILPVSQVECYAKVSLVSSAAPVYY